MKKYITGITATGKLTLGNYIGAIKMIREYQEKNVDIHMFVADLHALTLPINPKILKENILEQLKIYLALGIDVKKIKLFRQSEIIGHTELFYYLTCNSFKGQLERMTQFKDKSIKNKNNTENIPLGLLLYPVLMAADILLYDVDGVIVGQDQKQHLELTRDLAQRMNSSYNLDLKIPEPIIPKIGAKIMALKTPTKKMSKSDSDKNETIFLLDGPEIIRKKIMESLTDSENKVYYDTKNKPGVSNLLTIYSALNNVSIEETEKKFKDLNYKEFKTAIADEVIKVLEPIQKKYKSLTEKDVRKALDYNKKDIQKTASKILKKIEKGIGIK